MNYEVPGPWGDITFKVACVMNLKFLLAHLIVCIVIQ